MVLAAGSKEKKLEGYNLFLFFWHVGSIMLKSIVHFLLHVCSESTMCKPEGVNGLCKYTVKIK